MHFVLHSLSLGCLKIQRCYIAIPLLILIGFILGSLMSVNEMNFFILFSVKLKTTVIIIQASSNVFLALSYFTTDH